MDNESRFIKNPIKTQKDQVYRLIFFLVVNTSIKIWATAPFIGTLRLTSSCQAALF